MTLIRRYFVRNRTFGSALAVMEDHRDTPKLKAQRDAEHWRKCAADAREVASMVGLAESRRRMELMAEEYDRLAEQAERRVASG